MIQITPQMKILLATEPVDFRRGIDGLARVCRETLGADPFGGAGHRIPEPAGARGQVAGVRRAGILAMPQALVGEVFSLVAIADRRGNRPPARARVAGAALWRRFGCDQGGAGVARTRRSLLRGST